MRRGNVSHRRNLLIADLFRRIDMVEAWGRDMPLMLENAPDVAFREVVGLFIASFARPEVVATTPETTPEIAPTTPETTPEIALTTPETTPETAELRRKQLNCARKTPRNACCNSIFKRDFVWC